MLKIMSKLIVIATVMAWGSICSGQTASDAGKPTTHTNGVQAQRGATHKPLDKAALEKEFHEAMTGAVLSGIWQMTGENGLTGTEPLSEPKTEKYSIQSATKLGGDFWLVNARMEFAKFDVTVPVPIRVVWAGDTAVITVDEIPIPGVGKYSARVLVYRGFYSGVWMSLERNYGGILAGRITKTDKLAEPKAEKKAPQGSATSKK